ncbi:MAG: hypothetical protein Q9179_007356 [Wetmoreana sp. 5 TL-2023]
MGQLARETARTPPSEEDPPLEYIDRSLTVLGRTLQMQDQRIEKEFLAQRQFIAGEFRRVDERFLKAEQKIEQRFKEADEQFTKLERAIGRRFEESERSINRRFEESERRIDQRFEEADRKMRQRFNHAQRASRNFLRTRGWEEIYPVGSFDAQGGLHTPQYFPRTVRSFWRLRNPSQREKLVFLVRFYQIQGYEEWGQDTDSDLDDSSETTSSRSWKKTPSPTLEDAVHSNPHIAHRALAAHLGLVYDEIQKFMDRAQEMGQARAGERKKRSHDKPVSHERIRRPFKFEASPTEVTSPSDPLPFQERMS